MDRSNQFLEPERGGNIVGWAMKQLVIWSVAGVAVYVAVTNPQLFRGAEPESPARPTLVRADQPDPPRHEALRPLGKAAPPVTNTLALRAQSDGHVFLKAAVNGAEVPFIVDTGATLVSLTYADALKAGVAGNLNYTIPINVANGVAKAARVTLREIRIGQLAVDNVEGMVVQGNGGISLLGQSFLKRLQGYDMRGDTLTLTWQ